MNISSRPATAHNYSLVLKQIADNLLFQHDDYRLSAAATQLYSLCSSITGIDDSSIHTNDLNEKRLPNGNAISPKDAARSVEVNGFRPSCQRFASYHGDCLASTCEVGGGYEVPPLTTFQRNSNQSRATSACATWLATGGLPFSVAQSPSAAP